MHFCHAAYVNSGHSNRRSCSQAASVAEVCLDLQLMLRVFREGGEKSTANPKTIIATRMILRIPYRAFPSPEISCHDN